MVADIRFERALSQFLSEASTVRAMVAASESGKPAVEAIGGALLGEFGNLVRPNSVKQRIGRLIRPIMESQGFEPHKRCQPAKCELFTTGTVYRPEPQSIVDALHRYGIRLPDDLIQCEIRDAAEGVVGDPPFVPPNQPIDWSRLVSTPAEQELRRPLRAFVTALNLELRQQECRRNKLPNNQLKAGDRRRLSLDNLSHEYPYRHLSRVRTALKVGALYATGFTLPETARLLDIDERTVSEWVKDRLLYSAPIARSAPSRLPLFQFSADGLVPKIQTVLPALDAAIHPVGVFNWFTRPHPDLALEQTHFEPTSPRDWLLRHHPSRPVCQLAAAVPVGIAA